MTLPAWDKITTSEEWKKLSDKDKRTVYQGYLSDLGDTDAWKSLGQQEKLTVVDAIMKDAGFSAPVEDVSAVDKTGFVKNITDFYGGVKDKLVTGATNVFNKVKTGLKPVSAGIPGEMSVEEIRSITEAGLDVGNMPDKKIGNNVDQTQTNLSSAGKIDMSLYPELAPKDIPLERSVEDIRSMTEAGLDFNKIPVSKKIYWSKDHENIFEKNITSLNKELSGINSDYDKLLTDYNKKSELLTKTGAEIKRLRATNNQVDIEKSNNLVDKYNNEIESLKEIELFLNNLKSDYDKKIIKYNDYLKIRTQQTNEQAIEDSRKIPDPILETVKAIPPVVTAVAGPMAAMPGAGIEAAAQLLPRISADPDKLIDLGSLEDAQAVLDKRLGAFSEFITTPEQAQAVENIGLASKPFEMAGEGWRLIGAGINNVLKDPNVDPNIDPIPILEPFLASLGEISAVMGLPEILKKLKAMPPEQRALVTKEIADTVASEGLTEAELLRKLGPNSDLWKAKIRQQQEAARAYAAESASAEAMADKAPAANSKFNIKDSKLKAEPVAPAAAVPPAPAEGTAPFVVKETAPVIPPVTAEAPIKPAPVIPEFKDSEEAIAFGMKASPEELARIKELQVEFDATALKLVGSGNTKDGQVVGQMASFMREAIEANANPERFTESLKKGEERKAEKAGLSVNEVMAKELEKAQKRKAEGRSQKSENFIESEDVYNEIRKNEGKDAEKLVRSLNRNGVITVDTHVKDNYIRVQVAGNSDILNKIANTGVLLTKNISQKGIDESYRMSIDKNFVDDFIKEIEQVEEKPAVAEAMAGKPIPTKGGEGPWTETKKSPVEVVGGKEDDSKLQVQDSKLEEKKPASAETMASKPIPGIEVRSQKSEVSEKPVPMKAAESSKVKAEGEEKRVIFLNQIAEKYVSLAQADGKIMPFSIANKNAQNLYNVIENRVYSDIVHPDNKLSRKIFEEVTGEKLPAGVKATQDYFTQSKEQKKAVPEKAQRVEQSAEKPEEKNPFKDSVVKQIVYHSTNHIFDKFNTKDKNFGSHFGTIEQTNDIAKYRSKGAMTKPVYINLQNPLRIKYDTFLDNDAIIQQLIEKGIITGIKFGDQYPKNKRSTENIQKIIKDAGYDGIIYLNRNEGVKETSEEIEDEELFRSYSTDEEFLKKFPDAKDSYIVFDSSQVKSIYETSNQPRATEIGEQSTPAEEKPAGEKVKIEDVVVEDNGREKVVKTDLTKKEADKLSLKEQKQYLIAEIDKAIEQAPEEFNGTDYVKIEVPGDGIFRIINTKNKLNIFKKNVKGMPLGKVSDAYTSVPDFNKEIDTAIDMYGSASKAAEKVRKQMEVLDDAENKSYTKFLNELERRAEITDVVRDQKSDRIGIVEKEIQANEYKVEQSKIAQKKEGRKNKALDAIKAHPLYKELSDLIIEHNEKGAINPDTTKNKMSPGDLLNYGGEKEASNRRNLTKNNGRIKEIQEQIARDLGIRFVKTGRRVDPDYYDLSTYWKDIAEDFTPAQPEEKPAEVKKPIPMKKAEGGKAEIELLERKYNISYQSGSYEDLGRYVFTDKAGGSVFNVENLSEIELKMKRIDKENKYYDNLSNKVSQHKKEIAEETRKSRISGDINHTDIQNEELDRLFKNKIPFVSKQDGHMMIDFRIKPNGPHTWNTADVEKIQTYGQASKGIEGRPSIKPGNLKFEGTENEISIGEIIEGKDSLTDEWVYFDTAKSKEKALQVLNELNSKLNTQENRYKEGWGEKKPIPMKEAESSKVKAERETASTEVPKSKPIPGKKPSSGSASYGGDPDVGGYATNIKYVLELPELVRLARDLMDGKYPQIKKNLGKYAGMFYHSGKIVIKADVFRDEKQVAAVLAHEIGHLVDWLPDKDMKKGNILGRIASLHNYLKKTLPQYPGAPDELTTQDRSRLRYQAQKMAKAQSENEWIDEIIKKELPIEPQDVLNIWNAVDVARAINPDLYEYVARLSTAQKKAVVKDALQGVVRDELKQFAKVIEEKTGKQVKQELSEEEFKKLISQKYKDLINEEIKKRRLFDYENIMEELKELTRIWKPFDPVLDPKYTKFRYSAKELYADAFSALLNAPGFLKAAAPNFYEALFNYIENKPEVKRHYEDLQAKIASGEIESERIEEVYKMFKKGDDAYALSLDKESRFYDAVMRDFVDLAHMVLKKVRKVGERNIPAAENPRYKIEEMNYSGSEIEWLLTRVKTEIMKPLDKASLTWDDFGVELYLRRVKGDRSGIANPQGWTARLAEKKLEELKRLRTAKQNTGMEDAIKAFQDLRTYVIDKAEKTGRWDDEIIKMMRNDMDYATFDVIKYIEKRYGAGPSAKIYPQVGTFNEISNPATATIMKDISILKAINRGVAAESVTKFFKMHFPNEIKPAETKWNGKFQEIQPPDRGSGQGLIVYLKNGKPEGYYVDEWVADIFEKNPIEGHVISKVLGWLAQPFRTVFTEINPGFALFNVIRDYKRSVKNLPGASLLNFAKFYNKAIKPSFKSVYGIPDSVVDETLKGNMLISIADFRGQVSEDKQIDRLLKMYHLEKAKWDKGIIKPFGYFFHYLSNINRSIERIPKIAGYMYLKEKYPDLPDEVVGHMVRNIGSPAFLNRGRWYPIYNNFFLFSNAMKEGYRGDYEAMAKKPGEWWWKTAKYVFLPKLLMMAGAVGLLGAAVKAIFDGASDYDKANFDIIPISVTDSGKSVILRIPQDETGRLIGGLLWKVTGMQKKETITDLLDYMSGQVPTVSPAIDNLTAVVQYASGKNPYDSFYGSYAIPEQIFEAGGARSHNAFLKWMLNNSGAGIVYRFKNDDVDSVKGELEEILGYPIASNIIGRFIKVTDRGLKETIEADKQILKKLQAQENLAVKDALAKSFRDEELTDEEIQLILNKVAKSPEMIDRNMMTMWSRKYGQMYMEEFITAQTNEQKAAVLYRMLERDNLLEKAGKAGIELKPFPMKENK